MSTYGARHAGRDRPTLAVAVFAIVVLACPARIGAEEILVKADVKYLGWSIPEGKFKTCARTELAVGAGKIEKTRDKCQSSSGPGTFSATGRIMDIDATASTVTIEKGDKKAYKVIVRDEALKSGGLSMGSLKTGDKVTIMGPIEGHASSVRRVE
jgi:hypothetical protein